MYGDLISLDGLLNTLTLSILPSSSNLRDDIKSISDYGVSRSEIEEIMLFRKFEKLKSIVVQLIAFCIEIQRVVNNSRTF